MQGSKNLSTCVTKGQLKKTRTFQLISKEREAAAAALTVQKVTHLRASVAEGCYGDSLGEEIIKIVAPMGGPTCRAEREPFPV